MRLKNSHGREYEIRLDGASMIKIDHEERKNMSVSEYLRYAGVPLEQGYFEQMDGEIRQALIEDDPNGLIEITEEDLQSLLSLPVDWHSTSNEGYQAWIGEFWVLLYPTEGYADIISLRDYSGRLPSDDREGCEETEPFFRMTVPSYATGETGIADEEADLIVGVRNDNGDAGPGWPAEEHIVLKANPDRQDCPENNRAWIKAIEDYLSHVSADDLEDRLLEDKWILANGEEED